VLAYDVYYATNTRDAGEMVEKSRKKPPCDPKLGKHRRIFGEGTSEARRDASDINDLRAAHPPQLVYLALDSPEDRITLAVTILTEDFGLDQELIGLD
jgi:hypothetical protein